MGARKQENKSAGRPGATSSQLGSGAGRYFVEHRLRKTRGGPGRENRLKEALEDLGDQYHYLLVDCPPNVGVLTFNALMACSEVIIR